MRQAWADIRAAAEARVARVGVAKLVAREVVAAAKAVAGSTRNVRSWWNAPTEGQNRGRR